jgi:hypothetical protein
MNSEYEKYKNERPVKKQKSRTLATQSQRAEPLSAGIDVLSVYNPLTCGETKNGAGRIRTANRSHPNRQAVISLASPS